MNVPTSPTTLTTGGAARVLGLHPRALSRLIYESPILSEAFEVRGGRRLIPVESLDAIAIEARRCGLLPRQGGGHVR